MIIHIKSNTLTKMESYMENWCEKGVSKNIFINEQCDNHTVYTHNQHQSGIRRV